MICSSLCRVPFIAVLLLRFERTHILRGPVFGGWVKTNNENASRWLISSALRLMIRQTMFTKRVLTLLTLLERVTRMIHACRCEVTGLMVCFVIETACSKNFHTLILTRPSRGR